MICSSIYFVLSVVLFSIYEFAYVGCICLVLRNNEQNILDNTVVLTLLSILLLFNFVLICLKSMLLFYENPDHRFIVYLLTSIISSITISLAVIVIYSRLWVLHLMYILCSCTFLIWCKEDFKKLYREREHQHQQHMHTNLRDNNLTTIRLTTRRQILFYQPLEEEELNDEQKEKKKEKDEQQREPKDDQQQNEQFDEEQILLINNSIDNEDALTPVLSSCNSNHLHDVNVCSICMETMDLYPTCQLKCKHTFHTKCITQWLLQYSDSCAICRDVCVVDVF